jgi:serine/threonine protein kinase
LIDGSGVAQLGDFGLVTDDLLLGYGSAAGYSDHIALEVWQGRGTSVKSDIWALGMTLFRLLHGKQWYEEAARPRDLVPDGGFADTLKWLPHVPKVWRRVIRRMLADDPATRFQSAGQALTAISRLTTPEWTTCVTSTLVRWEQRKKSRLHIVEWQRRSRHKNEWSAWSEPLGAGRRRALDGATTVVATRQAVAQLEAYFAANSV